MDAKMNPQEHKTFKLWADFLFKDFQAYMGLKMALKTGKVKLRLAALRQMVPIFCGYGNNRYRWFVAVHLADTTQMVNDVDSLPLLFSTSLKDDAYACLGSDEIQETTKRKLLMIGSVVSLSMASVTSRANEAIPAA